ncbi:MAG: cytochrome P450, partial [Ktedonobacteraceae bacterium]|nr:cytochrome P450 [Ktedonobacteraceae bacterium]
QRLADELLDKAQSQGQMDLVRDFAYPLPINVISEMLGIPPEHRGQITRWSEALGKLGIMGPPDKEQRVQIREFYTYVEDLIVLKRQNPGNDLITQLIQVEERGDRLDTAELRAMVGILIFGGHETTSNFISMGMLMLLEHPTQLAQLKSDLSLIPTAVEELLRFNGPFTVIVPRFATQDLELGGQRIKRGDILIIMPPSINRDETQFAQADELQIARQLNNHLAFGQGVHVCLGAPLARLEGEIAFTTLLQRMPNLRLNAPRDSITWRVSGGLRGLNSLPVVF